VHHRSVRFAVMAGAAPALVPTAAPAATPGLQAMVAVDSGPVVTLDSSKSAGLKVDVRFTGANKAGSTFRRTVLKAHTVAAN
jgi:hypothetical protein